MSECSTQGFTVSKADIAVWSDLCSNVLSSKSASTTYVKKFVSMLVSMLTFHRRIFPESAFGLRRVEGRLVHILSNHTPLQNVRDFLAILGGSFQAIDRRVLDQMRLLITANERPGHYESIEEICLQFDYLDDGNLMVRHNEDFLENRHGIPKETRIGTLTSLGNIESLVTRLKPLPKTGIITITLLYKDDVDPNYEPPCFQPCNFRNYPRIENSRRIKIADMRTPFNRTRMTFRTSTEVFEAMSETVSTPKQMLDTQNAVPVDCPCSISDVTNLMLTCSICSKVQHGICFGIVKLEHLTCPHVCDTCADEHNKGTDIDMAYKEMNDKRALCLLRLALILCHNLSAISIQRLANNLNISKALAQELIVMLDCAGFTMPGSSSVSRQINTEKLIEVGIKNYFPLYYSEIASERAVSLDLAMEEAEVYTIESVDLEAQIQNNNRNAVSSADYDKEVNDLDLRTSQMSVSMEASKELAPRRTSRIRNKENILKPVESQPSARKRTRKKTEIVKKVPQKRFKKKVSCQNIDPNLPVTKTIRRRSSTTKTKVAKPPVPLNQAQTQNRVAKPPLPLKQAQTQDRIEPTPYADVDYPMHSLGTGVTTSDQYGDPETVVAVPINEPSVSAQPENSDPVVVASVNETTSSTVPEHTESRVAVPRLNEMASSTAPEYTESLVATPRLMAPSPIPTRRRKAESPIATPSGSAFTKERKASLALKRIRYEVLSEDDFNEQPSSEEDS